MVILACQLAGLATCAGSAIKVECLSHENTTLLNKIVRDKQSNPEKPLSGVRHRLADENYFVAISHSFATKPSVSPGIFALGQSSMAMEGFVRSPAGIGAIPSTASG